MRVIPVLDLRGGQAVLARGGRREAYAPVRSQLVDGGAASDPLVLARAYRDVLGCDEWYVADLDALAGGAVQR
ncbi:MAG TPA: HisA/HisF-related TIM barrel protein, partial [Gemmatimonadales bacterium]|nr:HisA/HisF-related TIM barrel protein [Gemmatimonadales bacterium]